MPSVPRFTACGKQLSHPQETQTLPELFSGSLLYPKGNPYPENSNAIDMIPLPLARHSHHNRESHVIHLHSVKSHRPLSFGFWNMPRSQGWGLVFSPNSFTDPYLPVMVLG